MSRAPTHFSFARPHWSHATNLVWHYVQLRAARDGLCVDSVQAMVAALKLGRQTVEESLRVLSDEASGGPIRENGHGWEVTRDHSRPPGAQKIILTDRILRESIPPGWRVAIGIKYAAAAKRTAIGIRSIVNAGVGVSFGQAQRALTWLKKDKAKRVSDPSQTEPSSTEHTSPTTMAQTEPQKPLNGTVTWLRRNCSASETEPSYSSSEHLELSSSGTGYQGERIETNPPPQLEDDDLKSQKEQIQELLTDTDLYRGDLCREEKLAEEAQTAIERWHCPATVAKVIERSQTKDFPDRFIAHCIHQPPAKTDQREADKAEQAQARVKFESIELDKRSKDEEEAKAAISKETDAAKVEVSRLYSEREDWDLPTREAAANRAGRTDGFSMGMDYKAGIKVISAMRLGEKTCDKLTQPETHTALLILRAMTKPNKTETYNGF